MFHMALFFIASGYSFQTKNVKTRKSFLRFLLAKVKALYIPFIVFNVMFILLNNVFLKWNLYAKSDSPGSFRHHYMSLPEILINCLKSFALGGITEMSGTFWFLRILFLISVMYGLTEHILLSYNCSKKNQSYLSVLFLAAGFLWLDVQLPISSIGLLFSYYSLFHLGTVLKKIKETNVEKCAFLGRGGGKKRSNIGRNVFGAVVYEQICNN